MNVKEALDHLYQTRNDLPANVRCMSIEVLNETLATCLDLYTQTKQAHWNVKGLDFYQVHLLFDDIATTVFEPIDLLAERVTALGGVAHGTARFAVKNSLLPEYPNTETMDEIDHLRAIADRLAIFCQQLRAAMDRTETWNDQGSNDLLTQISRDVDKKLWFVESHIQRHVSI